MSATSIPSAHPSGSGRLPFKRAAGIGALAVAIATAGVASAATGSTAAILPPAEAAQVWPHSISEETGQATAPIGPLGPVATAPTNAR
jgi:hypothetical protein